MCLCSTGKDLVKSLQYFMYFPCVIDNCLACYPNTVTLWYLSIEFWSPVSAFPLLSRIGQLPGLLRLYCFNMPVTCNTPIMYNTPAIDETIIKYLKVPIIVVGM